MTSEIHAVANSSLSSNGDDRRVISIAIAHDHILIGLAFLIAAVSFCFGERIPVGGGLGWDGQFYASLAREWHEAIADKPLNKYSVVRILPSAVIHFVLNYAGLPLDDNSIIVSFGVLNVACITVAAWLWVRIADALSIETRGKWIGFCTFFLSFAIAKHTGYYPVLTDVPAFAIGMGMLFCYLTNHQLGLYALTALGAFTWPTLLMQGMILLLFPRDRDLPAVSSQRVDAKKAPDWRNFGLAAYATFCFTLAVCWSLEHSYLPVCGFINPVRSVLGLSLLIAATYVFFVVYRVIDVDQLWKALIDLPVRNWRRVIAVVALFLTIRYLYHSWAPLQGHSYGKLYLLRLMIKAVFRPGIFLVGHAVYFGPIVILGVLLWPQVSREIRRYGVGISLASLFALLLGLDGESRHLMHAFPLVAPFVVLAVAKLNWGRRNDVAFFGFCLFASKIWFSMNSPGMLSGSGSLLEFPLQSYAMNYGVFMNSQTYLLQGIVVLVITWEMSRSVRSSFKNKTYGKSSKSDWVARPEPSKGVAVAAFRLRLMT